VGRPVEAVREVGDIGADPAMTGEGVYNCACIVSLACEFANNPDRLPHFARVVPLLRQAIAKGYADIPHLLADPDLAPLRNRPDYAALLWDIADAAAQQNR
jgi:hypothetical protein